MSSLPYIRFGALRPSTASDETQAEILRGLLGSLREATAAGAIPGYLAPSAAALSAGVVEELERRGEEVPPAPVFVGEPIRFVGPHLVRHGCGLDLDPDEAEELRRLFLEEREEEEAREESDSFAAPASCGLLFGWN